MLCRLVVLCVELVATFVWDAIVALNSSKMFQSRQNQHTHFTKKSQLGSRNQSTTPEGIWCDISILATASNTARGIARKTSQENFSLLTTNFWCPLLRWRRVSNSQLLAYPMVCRGARLGPCSFLPLCWLQHAC